MEEDVEYMNPHDETDPRFDAHELRTIHYRERLINTAKENGFKKDSIDAFRVFLDDIMSQNAILSNQTPPEKSIRSFFTMETPPNQLYITKLGIESSRERLLMNIDPTDKQKDIIYQMISESVEHTFNFTLTRAVGSEREGVVNRIEHSKTTQEIKQYEQQEREKEKKKRGGIY